MDPKDIAKMQLKNQLDLQSRQKVFRRKLLGHTKGIRRFLLTYRGTGRAGAAVREADGQA